MSFEKYYQEPDKSLWKGRLDSPPASFFFQIIKLLNLNNPVMASTSPFRFAILGFCCDEGIRRNMGRTGAAEGPNALRDMLARMPTHKQEVEVYDAGNITCKDHDLESAQQALSQAVKMLLSNGYTPILIGGGHEIAWGHYQGIAGQYPQHQLGIINIDTHFDMRPVLLEQKGSSGTPFLQIASAHEKANKRFDYSCIGIQEYGNSRSLYKTAAYYKTHIFTANDMYSKPADAGVSFVDRSIKDNDFIYLSLCLDVFSAGYAPGVSAPQAFGLTPWQIVPIIRQLASSGKVISYDIAELSPKYDADSRTAKLAANFIYEIIHHHQRPIAT
jgi:formiminoglutamase